MKPQLVPVILGGRRGVRPFDPIDLFTGGVQGAWYDPSDYSTLFQDSSGTTPVTAVEQPVGLMLDKSQGLVLGSELVTGAASAYTGNGTVSTVGDTVTATCTTNGTYGIRWTSSNISNIWTRCTFEVVTNSASKSLNFYPNLAHAGISVGTTTGSKTYTVFAPTASGGNQIPVFFISGLAGESFSVRVVSIKELPGNHASQATAASRPVLRARYNLLTYSEQFDNAAWSKSNTTVTANAVVAPDATTTADKLVSSATTSTHYAAQVITLVASTNYSASVYVKAAEYGWAIIYIGTVGVGRYINLSSGAVGSAFIAAPTSTTVTDAGNGWWRVVVVFNSGANTSADIRIYGTTADATSSYLGDGTSGIYIWGAQLAYGSSAGTYQRIAAATDYATAGFLPYLYFVTDDSFSTGSINFTGTNKMSVCAGVTKLSDGGAGNYGCIAELSADVAANLGTFNLFGPASAPGGTPDFGFGSKGSLGAGAVATGNAAPVTRVLTGQGDIAADVCVLRVNAANAATSSSDQGTGNFGNYPLFIGRRNNTLYPFNGNLYGLIVAGKTLSASELSATEAWMNSKTGAY